jgi:hypothetical protein
LSRYFRLRVPAQRKHLDRSNVNTQKRKSRTTTFLGVKSRELGGGNWALRDGALPDTEINGYRRCSREGESFQVEVRKILRQKTLMV